MRLRIMGLALLCGGLLAAEAHAVEVKGFKHANVDAITRGPDGAMWMTDDTRRRARLLRVEHDGRRTAFDLPRGYWLSGDGNATSIITGPDRALWFGLAHPGTDGEDVYEIGRMTTSGELTTFPLPSAGFRAFALAVGPDRAIWFVEQADSADSRHLYRRIGRITTDGEVTEYQVGRVRDRGYGAGGSIARGPDGAMWFTDPAVGKVGRISMRGEVKMFRLRGFWRPSCVDGPGLNYTCAPVTITAGPGGLWFGGAYGDKIVRMTTRGQLKVFRVARLGSQPVYIRSITRGPDRAIWFSTGSSVGRLNPATGASQQWLFPRNIAFGGGPIRTGPRRTLWFKSSQGFGRVSGIARASAIGR